MIGWKLVRIYKAHNEWTGRCAILKLDITGQVVSPHKKAPIFFCSTDARYATKFRTDKLKVLGAFRPHTNQPVTLKRGERFGAIYWEHRDYTYKVGRVHRPDRFNANPDIDCAPGLHFFVTRLHAENWDR